MIYIGNIEKCHFLTLFCNFEPFNIVFMKFWSWVKFFNRIFLICKKKKFLMFSRGLEGNAPYSALRQWYWRIVFVQKFLSALTRSPLYRGLTYLELPRSLPPFVSHFGNDLGRPHFPHLARRPVTVHWFYSVNGTIVTVVLILISNRT